MSANNWDVDTFKTEHECDEHWQLRRAFLLEHKDKFPEERLLCLAQVFINIEILGCRYPDATMNLVSSLAGGIVENFREKRKSKLKRTFVQASDAAQTKAQGIKRSSSGLDGNIRPNKFLKSISFQPASNSSLEENSSLAAVVDNISEDIASISSRNTTECNRNLVAKHNSVQAHHKIKYPTADNRTNNAATSSITHNVKNPFGKLILVENKFVECKASGILVRSFQLSGLPSENLLKSSSLPNGNTRCDLTIDGKVLFSSEGVTKLAARETVAENALDNMKEYCYTIEVLANYISESTVDKSLREKSSDKSGTALSSDNLGSKLLRMMGWSGGGLGKDSQGIETPVCAVEHMNRAGLGLTNLTIHQSKHKIRKLFENFLSNDSGYDLAFSSDFTKDERASIHQLARQFNLKTKSHGTGDDRHIVVSKKERPQDLLQRLIQLGGSTEKYNLIKPRCMM